MAMNVTRAQVEAGTKSLDVRSTAEEIARHEVAANRYPIIKLFQQGGLKAKQACEALGLSLGGFYRLCRKAEGSTGYQAIVPSKPGRKTDSVILDLEVEQLIEEMYQEHFKGPAATFAKVWRECMAEADRRLIIRPSFHTVSRRIKAKGEREVYGRKWGPEAANQRYGARPGFKVTTRPLEWVQIDHTVVDLLVVDDDDRTRTIGRPWLSLAICLHTRVILGFYLSFLPPSAVTVAMLIENCVMPKDRLLKSLNLGLHLWPMHGVMETLHADNAKEFVSDVLVLNCADYGISVKHRTIGRKHEGGHIESLIGKMMTKRIHFLRGTTYSNTIQRKNQHSDKSASITFSQLKKILVLNIHSYHQTKHKALEMTPTQKWENYYEKNSPARLVPEAERESFRYKLYPEQIKTVVNAGIEKFRRIYYSPFLDSMVREAVLIKYDPYDLSYIMVEVNGRFEKCPCVRNPFGRSNVYEIYRWQRQQKGERNGTITAEGATSTSMSNEIAEQEYRATGSAKRQKNKYKKEKGIQEHQKYSNEVSGTATNPAQTAPENPEGRKKVKPSIGANQLPSNVIDIRNLLSTQDTVEFDKDPVFY